MTFFCPKQYMNIASTAENVGLHQNWPKLIYDTDDYGVRRRRCISECKSRRRTGSNKHGLADTCAYGIDRDDVLIGEISVLKDLNLHKLTAYEGILLSGGNDVSSDYSS